MRVAVFVDAGYLYAQGSAALAGSKQNRTGVKLNRSKVIAKLREIAESKAGNAPLLRIYWYDGVPSRGLSPEQQGLADMDDVKLRLGVINAQGQQKGVDSLIVTDLVDLARNHAITDAVLLSGDEDVRIGVQIAQSFGVRIHLLGIEPSRGSQSRYLMQESDTTTEWSKAEIPGILTLKADLNPPVSDANSADTAISTSDMSALDSIVDDLLASLDRTQVSDAEIKSGTIPYEFDRALLVAGRSALGRDLEEQEKFRMRSRFKDKIEQG